MKKMNMSLILLLMVVAITACGNSAEDNSAEAVANFSIEEAVDEFIEENIEGEEFNPEEKPSVIGTDDPIRVLYESNEWMLSEEEMVNYDLVVELHQKAYAYSTSTYFVEKKLYQDGELTDTVKEYVKDGNLRSEQYDKNNQMEYLSIYNKGEDRAYTLDVNNNESSILEEVTMQGINYDTSTLGCFYVLNLGGMSDSFELTEIEGRSVYLSKLDYEGYSFESAYDAETGVQLYRIERSDMDGVQVEYKEEFELFPGQTIEDDKFDIE